MIAVVLSILLTSNFSVEMRYSLLFSSLFILIVSSNSGSGISDGSGSDGKVNNTLVIENLDGSGDLDIDIFNEVEQFEDASRTDSFEITWM